MKMENEKGYFDGMAFSPMICVTHSLFVDDLLVFGKLIRNQWFYLHCILNHFGATSGLCIKKGKSLLLYDSGDVEEIKFIFEFIGTGISHIMLGITYLGFRLKPCSYNSNDWTWLMDE